MCPDPQTVISESLVESWDFFHHYQAYHCLIYTHAKFLPSFEPVATPLVCMYTFPLNSKALVSSTVSVSIIRIRLLVLIFFYPSSDQKPLGKPSFPSAWVWMGKVLLNQSKALFLDNIVNKLLFLPTLSFSVFGFLGCSLYIVLYGLFCLYILRSLSDSHTWCLEGSSTSSVLVSIPLTCISCLPLSSHFSCFFQSIGIRLSV